MWSEIYHQPDPSLLSPYDISDPSLLSPYDISDPSLLSPYDISHQPVSMIETEDCYNKTDQLYHHATVFLDNYRQGTHRLWSLTNWFYNLESQFLPNQLPYIAFYKDCVTQDQCDYTLVFLPLTYEEKTDLDQQSIYYGYPFAKWSDEYQKWIFINPEPNEIPSRQCAHCQQPVTIGYRCNTCLKNTLSPIAYSNAISICTLCSINGVHENQYDQNHNTQLAYARHCDRKQIIFNHNLVIIPTIQE